MAANKYRGSFTALVTPFKNGKVDDEAFRKLVDWQISEGTHGLVPVGTTGESPTLSHEEHKHVVEMCINEAKGRVPLDQAIFIEPGLCGAKYGLSVLGKVVEEVRLPLVPVTESTRAAIRAAMLHAGLIN